MNDMTAINRRGMLKGTAATATLATTLSAIMTRQADAAAAFTSKGEQTAFADSPYGPIAPVNCLNTGLPLLQLPRGFTYRSFGWAGDMMKDGQPTPSWHDGMAVVSTGTGRNAGHVLIRNHELRSNGVKFVVKNLDGTVNADASYDTGAAAVGGCTALRVVNGVLVDDRAVIAETDTNCAGGQTPWGTWLTCEETIEGVDNVTDPYLQTHGWVFEVSANPEETRAEPILDMGRRSHEAVAFDPRAREVYMTEDFRNAALFYKYVPNNKAGGYGSLHGGALFAARVIGKPKAELMALNGTRATDVNAVGESFSIEWVRIANPAAAPLLYTENNPGNPAPLVNTPVSSTFAQGRDLGALRMSRGEGCWYSAQEDAIYYTDTNFGYEASGQLRAGRGVGAVWRYKPNRGNNGATGTLTLVFAGTRPTVGNAPDNICVSPRGGVLTMEDGSAVVDQFGRGNRVLGFTNQGQAWIFAKNNIVVTQAQLAAAGKSDANFFVIQNGLPVFAGDQRGNEFAGGCFSADGRVFYVNIQTPGITFAITGPWSRGNI